MRRVMREGESKTDFLREAVEAELQKREQAARRTVALRNVAGWIG